MAAWERLAEKLAAAAGRKHGPTALLVAEADGPRRSIGVGGLDIDDPYAIDSVSKLFTHALIFQLIDQRLLRYDDRLLELWPEAGELLPGLEKVTVRQLVNQTSGLPAPDDDEALARDREVALPEMLRVAATMKRPAGRHAHYSGLNAGLLAQVAAEITAEPFPELLHRGIFAPLGLHHTAPAEPTGQDYAAIMTAEGPVRGPRYLAGAVASGGIISTAREQVHFIRAFHEGELFERRHITDPAFRRIQLAPLQYGAGMMSMTAARSSSELPAPEILGHSGSTGSFAFYCPSRELFLAGTINTVLSPPYPVIYQALDAY